MRLTLVVLCGLLVAPAFAQQPAKEHPLAPAVRLAQSSRKTLDAVADYEAIFTKYEVNGGKAAQASMKVLVRHEPFSVYMYFLGNDQGREVLYVHGKNDNKLLAHETGIKSIVGTVALDPTSPRVMKESKHPITSFGMKTMVDMLINEWQTQMQFGETEVQYYPNAKLGEVACKVIQVSHPRPRKEFPSHITRLYIEANTNLPVRVEHYGYPKAAGQKPPLVGQYTYSKVRTNLGLQDIAFDPRNSNYKF